MTTKASNYRPSNVGADSWRSQ